MWPAETGQSVRVPGVTRQQPRHPNRHQGNQAYADHGHDLTEAGPAEDPGEDTLQERHPGTERRVSRGLALTAAVFTMRSWWWCWNRQPGSPVPIIITTGTTAAVTLVVYCHISLRHSNLMQHLCSMCWPIFNFKADLPCRLLNFSHSRFSLHKQFYFWKAMFAFVVTRYRLNIAYWQDVLMTFQIIFPTFASWPLKIMQYLLCQQFDNKSDAIFRFNSHPIAQSL